MSAANPFCHDSPCLGHYFENEQFRGLDYCDGSSRIQHSDGSYWEWFADGPKKRLTDDRDL